MVDHSPYLSIRATAARNGPGHALRRIVEHVESERAGGPSTGAKCQAGIRTADYYQRRLAAAEAFLRNVVDLMKLEPSSEHPHGLSDRDFDVLFTKDKPVIFGFHGYPWLIHRLTYRRTNHANVHVRG